LCEKKILNSEHLVHVFMDGYPEHTCRDNETRCAEQDR
jgi:hypothetical protein